MRRLLLPLVLFALHAARADYLFTYFTKNGEDGLHLASSVDGLAWQRVQGGRSFLQPAVGKSKLMRDPCALRAPDGTYHLVWTSGWNENNIGYASTRDFRHWTDQREIPVMAHEPTVRNCWAPEIVYDEARRDFVIFWASTIPGRFAKTTGASENEYNHRMYFTATKDFVAFAPTALFYDPGFSVIDATFLRARGRLYLIVKDETRHPPKKYLQLAEAKSVRGPFGPLSPPFSPPELWVEGPTALEIGGDAVVYYDAYQAKRYGALRSRDLKTWEDISSQLKLPDEGTAVRIRHGTVLEVPAALIAELQRE